jgi:hypothetical protein
MLVYVEIVKDYEDIYLFVFELKTIGNQKKIAHDLDGLMASFCLFKNDVF